jgi:ATPase subunit of ABC transporter with duplicated ATPase domains
MALEVEGLAKAYDETLFENLDLKIEVGERIAIIGPNGIGKSTLMKCLVGDTDIAAGTMKWSENSAIAYYAQDHAAEFESDMNLMEWMSQWGKEGDDEQVIRGTLGRLLFSNNDISKKVSVISGGEQGRMLFGKMMLKRPNIMLMDEPTNHLDMESIESLNLALENYAGTLIFVSHDREFVSSLATRIIELTPNGIVDFHGTYEDYLTSQAIN